MSDVVVMQKQHDGINYTRVAVAMEAASSKPSYPIMPLVAGPTLVQLELC